MTESPQIVDSESSDGDDPDEDERDAAADHLAEVPVGAGCTEIWDHLSDQRRADDA